MALSHLECGLCGQRHDASKLQTVCIRCKGSLLARYDVGRTRAQELVARWRVGPRNIWRFADLLPVEHEENRITLGEAVTPVLDAHRIAEPLGLRHVWIKDEGLNPTGSFKARGLCVAVARGVELGVKRFAIPTAGNAGVALAAYAARAGAEAHVFVPKDAPPRILDNLARYGAHVTTVAGLISDAGKTCADFVKTNTNALDVSTLKEPYRAEGKKTMGFELATDLKEEPDAVIYPTGGGTGIVGIDKAYQEMRALGWPAARAPRMYSIQAAGCAPVVKALEEGAETCAVWPNAATSAAGLRVPKPYADRLVLRALRKSNGGGIAVSEAELTQGVTTLASMGVNASPEGGAAWAGLAHLVKEGLVRPAERIVVFNTGSGLAY